MKLRKKDIRIEPNRICSSRCGPQPNKPIIKKVVSYEDKESGDLIVLGKDKNGDLTSVLYDKEMRIKKETDSKSVKDYSDYSKSALQSRKKFSQEGGIGKARITFQMLQDWGY